MGKNSAPREQTVTQVQRLPPETLPFLVGEDGILQRAQDLSMMPITMPEHQVAARTDMQSMADRLGREGIGAFLPQLEEAFGLTRRGTDVMEQGLGVTNDALAQIPGLRDRALGLMDEGAALTRTTTGAFDPQSYQGFMNPFLDAVVQQAEQDLFRQEQLQRQDLQSNAASVGAFGGSRQAIAERELGRNAAEQVARTTSQLRFEGFGEAMRNAMTAFEDQQRRTSAAGNQLATIGTGVGNTGTQMVTSQLESGRQMGVLGQGIWALGQQTAGLAEQGQRQQTQDINTLLTLGSQQQQQQQMELDAARQTAVERILQPFQQLGFFADIFQGSPTGTNTFVNSAQPGPSPLSQIAGLGMGIGSLANVPRPTTTTQTTG